jgi:hypothetical protein
VVLVLSPGHDLGGSPRLWDFPIAEYHGHPVSPESLARRDLDNGPGARIV